MTIKRTVLILLLVMTMALPSLAGEKVAILDFRSLLAPTELGVAVAEILRTELIGLGDYTVIERGMLEQVLNEQELQLTGAVDSETAVTIGRLVGAKLVVIGSIVKTGSVYTINSRFIDVETGIAKVGQNIRGQGEDQISHMVHQLALIIAGKTVTTEDLALETQLQPGRQALLSLFSFETDQEIQQWRPWAEPPKSMERAEAYATQGSHSLHIVFPKKTAYPEVDTTSCPADWSSYTHLTFDLYYEAHKDESPWRLGVRVDDRQTTPANQQWFVSDYLIFPGSNTLRLPLDDVAARVDLTRISRLMLFTDALEQTVSVYLDHVRLEHALPPQPGEPFVFSFETRHERNVWLPTSDDSRIVLSPSTHHASQGTHSLKVALPKASANNEYPGITSEHFPQDWSNYTVLAADLFLENDLKRKPPDLAVRIDDVNSTSFDTRFNWDMALHPGANSLRIPVEMIQTAIAVDQITAVYLFLVEPREKVTFYLDNLRIE